MYKFEMYKTGYVEAHCYQMYKLYVTGCIKKSLSKPINMGSSFEDLGASNSKVKTVRNLDKQFSRYFFLILVLKNKRKNSLHPYSSFLSLPPHFNSGCDTWRILKQQHKGEGATWREESGGKVPFTKGFLFLTISKRGRFTNQLDGSKFTRASQK